MRWASLFHFFVRFEAGDGDLQAVIIDRNLGPSQKMHLAVGHGRINTWFRCDMTRECLQKGGNKSGVYALGFETVDQEEFEVFHQMKTSHRKGTCRISS